jgi:hypothetical protein
MIPFPLADLPPLGSHKKASTKRSDGSPRKRRFPLVSAGLENLHLSFCCLFPSSLSSCVKIVIVEYSRENKT